MSTIHTFTFNPFQENTYVISDESKECIVVDPGCYSQEEKDQLAGFIQENDLKVQKLINTHCHVDHVFGNKFVSELYGVDLYIHLGELPVLAAYLEMGALFGIQGEPSPTPAGFLEEGEEVGFGNTKLKVILTPGHSPASISFYCEEDAYLIAGDVLFQGSIGRTDLPGGDFTTLINSIKNKLFTLPDSIIVYPGHGPYTTIGEEKRTNPFLIH